MQNFDFKLKNCPIIFLDDEGLESIEKIDAVMDLKARQELFSAYRKSQDNRDAADFFAQGTKGEKLVIRVKGSSLWVNMLENKENTQVLRQAKEAFTLSCIFEVMDAIDTDMSRKVQDKHFWNCSERSLLLS